MLRGVAHALRGCEHVLRERLHLRFELVGEVQDGAAFLFLGPLLARFLLGSHAFLFDCVVLEHRQRPGDGADLIDAGQGRHLDRNITLREPAHCLGHPAQGLGYTAQNDPDRCEDPEQSERE